MDDETGQAGEPKDPLAEITAEAARKAQETDAELEARLNDFHDRAVAGGAKQRATKVRAGESGTVGGGAAKGLGHGLTIAYGFIGTPIVLYFVGKLIDGPSEPKWQLILGGLGAVLGFVWVLVSSSRAK